MGEIDIKCFLAVEIGVLNLKEMTILAIWTRFGPDLDLASVLYRQEVKAWKETKARQG